MTKPIKHRRSLKTKSRLPELPNIGPGSGAAMKFRKFVSAEHPFSQLVKLEKAILSKPINDLSDLQPLAEMFRYYNETSGEKLEDFLQYGGPEACGPRLALAVMELVLKQSARMPATSL